MAGLRCLDRDVGGFFIADFADHDDVRILAQKRAQRDGEGEASLLAHADLIDSGELDFSRIFDRTEVARFGVEHLQEAVQQERLAAARWTGNKHQSVRRTDGRLERVALSGGEAERIERKGGRQCIQAPEHKLFPEQRGQRIHTIVLELARGGCDAQAPVLRHAPLGDVHACEHFHARDEGIAQMGRRLCDGMQHAVNAQTHSPTMFGWLDMKVRRVAPCGFPQRVAQQADWGVVGLGEARYCVAARRVFAACAGERAGRMRGRWSGCGRCSGRLRIEWQGTIGRIRCNRVGQTVRRASRCGTG